MTCNIYLIFHNFLMKYKLIFWNWIYFKYRRTYMWFKKCITSSIHTRYLNVSITKNTPDYSIVLANFWLPYLVICNFEQSMLQSWPLNGGTIYLLIQSHVRGIDSFTFRPIANSDSRVNLWKYWHLHTYLLYSKPTV